MRHLQFRGVVLVAAASKCHKGMHGALTRGDEVEGKWNCWENRQRIWSGSVA
jgi:hypothetical protein